MTMRRPSKSSQMTLEMVEAGVTDRFVTSYEKPGSKFASNNRKMTF